MNAKMKLAAERLGRDPIYRAKQTAPRQAGRRHGRTGSACNLYVGDAVGNRGAHLRLEAERGKGRHELCVDCGKWSDEWSYAAGAPDERIDKRGDRFSLDFSYYVPRCRGCHARYDRQVKVTSR